MAKYTLHESKRVLKDLDKSKTPLTKKQRRLKAALKGLQARCYKKIADKMQLKKARQ
jgi:predicted transcriptional regulator